MDVRTAARIRLAGRILFWIYVAVLVYILFFAEKYGRTDTAARQWNLMPLREIRRYLMNAEAFGTRLVVINLLGNILLFVPFGAILPVLHRPMRRAWKVIGLSAALSAAIELTQLVTRVGSCDIDDVILNTLGGALGYLLFAVCNRQRLRMGK